MTKLVDFPVVRWAHSFSEADQLRALHALEQGSVLSFSQLGFSINDDEGPLLTPAIAATSKNVSLDLSRDTLRGSTADNKALGLLRGMMQRFATSNRTLLRTLLPRYDAGLLPGRISFRPAEIAGRTTSWRKDDTRLHVDSFPSSPVQDKRILRVFSNINPHGKSRHWRLGEPFERVASRYFPSLPRPMMGTSQLLKLAGITKSRRSAYDHFMLQLHDRMKADLDYQSNAEQMACAFKAGSTWLAFTDQTSHAAMAGQFVLEQTWYLPVACMAAPSQSPLRILERLAGRELT